MMMILLLLPLLLEKQALETTTAKNKSMSKCAAAAASYATHIGGYSFRLERGKPCVVGENNIGYISASAAVAAPLALVCTHSTDD